MRGRLALAGPLLAAALSLGGVLAAVAGPEPAQAVAMASGGGGIDPAVPPPLSLQQLAGQRVIYSYRGLTPPSALLSLIRAGKAAGVIFFSENISSQAQLRGVVARLQSAAAASPVKAPLLMMTDQEGGLVRRLSGPPAASEKQIGASSQRVAAAQTAGRNAGGNLKGAGVNVNLAPVLDVFRTPGNFIDQFQRSYSSDSRVVSSLGAAFIGAQQQTGVAATAKHFPGLGAAASGQDTDQAPVTLHLSLPTVRAVDELPYQAAVSVGVQLVMASWAVYPALDSRMPAGLSARVIQGELRRRLGFAGVTVTDALGAGALDPFGTTANRALLAARAGMDVLLCASQSLSEGVSALQSLAGALRAGKLDQAAFRASVQRVTSLRQRLPG